MLAEVKQTVTTHWKTAIVLTILIIGLFAYERMIGVLAAVGIPALLLIAICVVPCLAPIVYLRRKWNGGK